MLRSIPTIDGSPTGLPVILLAGPTASGKTALAMELVDRLRATIPVELISVDSAQVFRDMNVGTAKPNDATLARYPHHLIDLISPEETYSAGRFLRDAQAVVAQIHARGHLPLLVGGTMLYFKVLQEGLAALPPADPAMRQLIEDEAAQKGWPALHAELAQLDPAGAARIDPNHSQRIQRALELVRSTGRPLADLYAEEIAAPGWKMLSLALFPNDRGELHRRIDGRFSDMLDAGLIEEVRTLRQRYSLRPELPSMRCVGYRQAWDYLDGRLNLPQLVDQGQAATRQLAKRQITWLRSLPFDRLDPDAPTLIDALVHNVQKNLSRAA